MTPKDPLEVAVEALAWIAEDRMEFDSAYWANWARKERAEKALAEISRLREAQPSYAAEQRVGRYVYDRIEKLMDAKAGTPEGDELAMLAAIVDEIEEWGETDRPFQIEAQPSDRREAKPPSFSDEDLVRAARAFLQAHADTYTTTAEAMRDAVIALYSQPAPSGAGSVPKMPPGWKRDRCPTCGDTKHQLPSRPCTDPFHGPAR